MFVGVSRHDACDRLVLLRFATGPATSARCETPRYPRAEAAKCLSLAIGWLELTLRRLDNGPRGGRGQKVGVSLRGPMTPLRRKALRAQTIRLPPQVRGADSRARNFCALVSRCGGDLEIRAEFPAKTMSRLEAPCALKISELRKSFDRPAVDGLNLTVRLGEIYALLGPNDAGKTTALRMVAGLLPPDAGAISILGIDALHNPVAAKKVTAWIPDEPMIYDKLTPFEYLEFVAGLWGVDAAVAQQRARDLLGWLGLGNHAYERCERFSKGMRQKVALAGALLHEPRLIILDEPLTGLDAASSRQVKSVLRECVTAGGAVVMTTHILDVAERMADRIGIIAEGRLIVEGTLDELRRHAGKSASTLEETFLTLVAGEAVAA
jgi:ABC-2 type transport system ATP-binding protein